jgi:hypothetical protein
VHAFSQTEGLRGGPAPLTLASLGRWAGITAAAGGPPSGGPRVAAWSVLVSKPPHQRCSRGVGLSSEVHSNSSEIRAKEDEETEA